MNDIKVTIELCAEDRARLDRILTALENGAAHPDCSACAEGVVKAMVAATGEADAEQPQAPVQDAPAPVDTPEPEKPAEPQETAKAEEPAPTVERSDVQRKVVELSAAGKKEKVREIVKAYAVKVSDIPEDKLLEVWQKLTALEG